MSQGLSLAGVSCALPNGRYLNLKGNGPQYALPGAAYTSEYLVRGHFSIGASVWFTHWTVTQLAV